MLFPQFISERNCLKFAQPLNSKLKLSTNQYVRIVSSLLFKILLKRKQPYHTWPQTLVKKSSGIKVYGKISNCKEIGFPIACVRLCQINSKRLQRIISQKKLTSSSSSPSLTFRKIFFLVFCSFMSKIHRFIYILAVVAFVTEK